MDTLKLLKCIEPNAHLDIQDLAVILNETTNDVEQEMKQLEKDGIIRGYHTVINWDKTNSDSVNAIIQVSATPERDRGYDKIASQIYKYPEVSNMYLLSGNSEFLVFINGKTMQEVSNFVAQKLAPIEGVKATVTLFVLKRYKIDGVILEDQQADQERMLVTP